MDGSLRMRVLTRLRALEWSGNGTWGLGFCVACERPKQDGHRPDCGIDVLIREVEAEPEPRVIVEALGRSYPRDSEGAVMLFPSWQGHSG